MAAYRRLQRQDRRAVRELLMDIYGVKRSRLYDLMNDYYNIPLDEKVAVENLFKNYQIPPEELWKIWQDG